MIFEIHVHSIIYHLDHNAASYINLFYTLMYYNISKYLLSILFHFPPNRGRFPEIFFETKKKKQLFKLKKISCTTLKVKLIRGIKLN